MLFNSWEFIFFLTVVFALFWSIFYKKRSLQNIFIIVISYIFYGWWDWRFLGLIAFSSGADYVLGLKMGFASDVKIKRLFLGLSLVINLGVLGFFKYYNFFVKSFISAFHLVGFESGFNTLDIILPVGISFYTFQTLSYTIDIYNGKIEPTKDWKAFFAFVSFFPQLVAGPIERASHLLPQFFKTRKFDYPLAVSGLQLILWGMLKKVVIADNCAIFVNPIFENPTGYSSAELGLGMIFFAFQIYGDFSGYSDIAIGTGRLFGFDLNRNFNYPYFSGSIREFWTRWHISLSTWFRDYVFIPLGGSKVPFSKLVVNIYITFVISGLWHGANYTFLAWGFIHASLYITQSQLKKWNLVLPSAVGWLNLPFNFFLVCIAWVFFRAGHLKLALWYIKDMFSFNGYSLTTNYLSLIVILCCFSLIEFQRKNQISPLNNLSISKTKRWVVYTVVLITIFLFGKFDYREFIYFQF